jgi:lipopolysaccharide export system permease protein
MRKGRNGSPVYANYSDKQIQDHSGLVILLRYFSREVLYNTLAIALVLLLVFLSQRFVKYLGNAAAGDIDPSVLLPLLFYRIPGMLELILPLALFVALLLVYGRLYLDNEMRVLFAAGISRWYLLSLTLVPVSLLAVLVGWISLSVSPQFLAKAQTMWQNQEDRSELDSLSEGKFHPFRNKSGVIYVEHMSDTLDQEAQQNFETDQPVGKLMEHIYIFQNNYHAGEEVIVVAERGWQIKNGNGRYLLLENGYRLRMLEAGQRVEQVDFARYGQQIKTRSSTEYQDLKVNALPTQVLRSSDRPDYRATWQWRISLIFLVPVVALLAIAFGRADARQGRYFKVLPAILVYLVYLVLLNMVRDYLADGNTLRVNLFVLIHSLFGLLALVMLYWEDFYRRYIDRQGG